MKKFILTFDFWINLILVFTGTPLLIVNALWSMSGTKLFGMDPPKPDTSLQLILFANSILLVAFQLKFIIVKSKIENTLKLIDQTSFVRYGKSQSISQVNLMLDEVQHLLATASADVRIYEAHLEPSAPNDIIEAHKKLVEYAAQKDRSLRWEILVGQRDNEKEVWINKLQQNMAEHSKGIYTVHSLPKTKPSFNFIVIPSIDQVYLGLGEWLGDETTGGVWIKNKHFASAMASMFRKMKAKNQESG